MDEALSHEDSENNSLWLKWYVKKVAYGKEFHFEVDQLYAIKVSFVINVVYCFHVGGDLQNMLH